VELHALDVGVPAAAAAAALSSCYCFAMSIMTGAQHDASVSQGAQQNLFFSSAMGTFGMNTGVHLSRAVVSCALQ
jgi:hypothetical protein